ncbi:MAG: hypothetical protein ABFS42_02820 [Candidatus Krumholzibacteriota bacterium]
MMKMHHFKCLLIAVTLLVAAGVALAGDGSGGIDLPDSYLPNGDCLIGNLNPPVIPSYPDVFTGNEAYAYHVKPSDQCGCPEEHFTLETITMLVDFEANQIPQTLAVTPSLLSAVFNAGSGCFEPGPPLCIGPDIVVNVNDPGIQTITVPLLGCGPFPLGNDYFLSLAYEGGAPANLVIDNDPQACTEFINNGNGWVDMSGMKSKGDKTGGGKLIVYGDIVCAAPPVGVESRAWGAIKSLFH